MLDRVSELDAKFEKYHSKNPTIYTTLVTLAYQAKNAGKSKIGVGMLWEIMRWEHFLSTDDESKFKLCNSYRSRYARLIMENEEGLQGIFNTRSLRA
jgi:hypothetical protein